MTLIQWDSIEFYDPLKTMPGGNYLPSRTFNIAQSDPISWKLPKAGFPTKQLKDGIAQDVNTFGTTSAANELFRCPGQAPGNVQSLHAGNPHLSLTMALAKPEILKDDKQKIINYYKVLMRWIYRG